MRYRAVVATSNEDATGYRFSEAELDELAQHALGRQVLLMFAQEVGVVQGSACDGERVSITFESDRDLAGLYAVPAFKDGKLDAFGLVGAAMDDTLTAVREET